MVELKIYTFNSKLKFNILKEYLMMHLYLDVRTCFGSILTDQLAEIEIGLCDQRLMDFCVMV